MKKRYALLLTGLLTLSLAKQDVALRLTMQERLLHRRFLNHRRQRVQSRQQRVRSRQQMYRTQQIREKKKTITGTIDEIKDFMFIITDESGAKI